MSEQPTEPLAAAQYTVTATSGEEVGHATVSVPGLPVWADVPVKWATWSAVDAPTWTAMTTFPPKEDG
ncbi:hypothetical protein [Streptomyces triticagri]|uniref:hypothetical protein n=1 Tax=Streptomyces triticagri TaxID=2293568 RepID=UPI000FFC14A4|nr:hypothetical protein [Streptomyces triticagri]